MVYQLHKNQTIMLLLILLALTALLVTAIVVAGNSGGDVIVRAFEGGGSPIYGTFDINISPWGIDAERIMWLF